MNEENVTRVVKALVRESCIMRAQAKVGFVKQDVRNFKTRRGCSFPGGLGKFERRKCDPSFCKGANKLLFMHTVYYGMNWVR